MAVTPRKETLKHAGRHYPTAAIPRALELSHQNLRTRGRHALEDAWVQGMSSVSMLGCLRIVQQVQMQLLGAEETHLRIGDVSSIISYQDHDVDFSLAAKGHWLPDSCRDAGKNESGAGPEIDADYLAAMVVLS